MKGRHEPVHDPRRCPSLGAKPDAGADSSDGLVALASIVSKSVAKLWMDAFDAHWRGRIPGLRPTAGYRE